MSYLFQLDADISPTTDEPHQFALHFSVPPDSLDYFRTLVTGTKERLKEIDTQIEDSAENWKLYRMEAVDRSILRMATFELLECKDTDFQVIIDEAVELSKQYGSENSPSFVNGILDKLAKKIRS